MNDPIFEARLEALRADLLVAVRAVYPDPETVTDHLIAEARAAFADRDPELRALDEQRLVQPDWFQRPEMLGYAAYTDRFADTLGGVAAHASYLAGLGVRYLHLMPLLEPRPAPNDGGYAVLSYRRVRPDLGTNDDLRALTGTLRGHGISLCVDLVLNHVAREHEWAEAARGGDAAKRDYFLVFPDRTMPDAYEHTLPEVFPDFAPGNFTWDEELSGWVWTTFNDYQWDLDWSNPEVLREFAAIVFHLANLGVEVFRLDAIAFLWKRLGTNCQNQPEVHEITRILRTLARLVCPAVLFKAEAIVGPADLPAYLGVGGREGKVSDLAYHNSLMVQIWSMLASQDVRLAAHALQQMPPPPSSTSWITYVRCHDDIGWAIDDGDAAALGLTGHQHRRFLSDWYSGDFPSSWARGMVFQENRSTGDRRISGTTASLAGLQCRDPWAVDRILLAHAVILSFGGLPVIWMGDEVPLLNDAEWADEPAHAGDNRWVHRPRMPWPCPPDEYGVQTRLAAMVRARASLPQLHARVPTEIWDPRDPGVLLVVRRHPGGPLLAAANVTAQHREISADVLYWLGMSAETARDHLEDRSLQVRGDAVLLPPYACAWLTGAASASTVD